MRDQDESDRAIVTPVEGVDPETAERVLACWASLKMRWLERDARGVQENLDKLAALLPTVAVGCNSRAGAEAQERVFPRRRTMVWYAGSRIPEPWDGPPPLPKE